MDTSIIPHAVRVVIASLILFSFELIWFDWDRDAYSRTQSNPHRSNCARTETESWNQWTEPVSRSPLLTNVSPLRPDLSGTVRSRADCTGANKSAFFLSTTGVSMNNFQPSQSTLLNQNRDATKFFGFLWTVRSSESAESGSSEEEPFARVCERLCSN